MYEALNEIQKKNMRDHKHIFKTEGTCLHSFVSLETRKDAAYSNTSMNEEIYIKN